MGDILNISLVGVGGQGILLASEILCRVGLMQGKDVKKSEVHGMAQRGGSVVSQIRIGEKVYSPLIGIGETDYLISFEKLEALRYAEFVAPDGVVLVNDQEIRPVTVSSGQAAWPEDLDSKLRSVFPRVDIVPALAAAKELGNMRVVNCVMIGALSTYLTQFEDDVWRQAIVDLVPPKVLELNLKAFDEGKKRCCNVL
jgi:indolepyruvate ferredoxin oxidoreductase, beta subunit